MFELKKLITAMILPPFNILILWGLSIILAKFNFKKLSRIFDRTWFLSTLSFKHSLHCTST